MIDPILTLLAAVAILAMDRYFRAKFGDLSAPTSRRKNLRSRKQLEALEPLLRFGGLAIFLAGMILIQLRVEYVITGAVFALGFLIYAFGTSWRLLEWKR